MALRQISEAEFNAEVGEGSGWVLVDFTADWCGPCRMLAPQLERFASENAERLSVVKVNIDQDEPLSDRFGVRTIPTVIAFKDGEEKARVVNPQSRRQLEALLGEAA